MLAPFFIVVESVGTHWLGLAYWGSYSTKFTQQIYPLVNPCFCVFMIPKPSTSTPAAKVEAFQMSLLPGFLGSCRLRFLCSQRFLDLILSQKKTHFVSCRSKDRPNAASCFFFSTVNTLCGYRFFVHQASTFISSYFLCETTC